MWRNARYASQWSASLETYAFPTLGNHPVGQINSADVLKMVRRLGREAGPQGPASPAVAAVASAKHTMADAVMNYPAPSLCFFWLSWLVPGLNPALR